MKKQQGGALAIVLVILGIIGALVVAGIMMVVSANNTAAGLDAQIKAAHTDNKNVLSQYNQKVLEAAQVPEMMRDDLIKVATAAIEGRYGAGGSKAVFQAISEQNPNVDSQVYVKIQQIIEAGRNEFQNRQTKLIDIKSTYEAALNRFPQGPLMRMLGYPKVPLDTYNIVTTDRTEKAFQTGKEEGPLKLRNPQ